MTENLHHFKTVDIAEGTPLERRENDYGFLLKSKPALNDARALQDNRLIEIQPLDRFGNPPLGGRPVWLAFTKTSEAQFNSFAQENWDGTQWLKALAVELYKVPVLNKDGTKSRAVLWVLKSFEKPTKTF